MHRMILRLLTAAAAAAMILGSFPAQAALTICNKSTLPTRVALRDDLTAPTGPAKAGGRSRSKHSVPAFLTGPLDARYYYLYATDGGAGIWEGKTHFCVAPQEKFLAPGRGDCAKRGFDRRGFFEMDTGGSADWTQTLSH